MTTTTHTPTRSNVWRARPGAVAVALLIAYIAALAVALKPGTGVAGRFGWVVAALALTGAWYFARLHDRAKKQSSTR